MIEVIDGFFPHDTALNLEAEFPVYDDSAWFVYDNALERKKTLNSWERFPAATYRTIYDLCYSTNADFGLHGGGWHIMASGGNLNPHCDYEVHPKLGKARQRNLIVYLSSDYKAEYGGHLGFWEDGKLVREIAPIFNRAVIFDTKDCWHGLATPFVAPEGMYRKSIAIYYLGGGCEDGRTRALFAAREGQTDVDELIQRRLKGEYK